MVAANIKQVVLVDEHPIILESLKSHLERNNQFEVVATSTSSDKAFYEILDRTPDLVIMDVELPGRGAFAIADQISSRLPATQIVFFTDYLTDVYLDMALRLGVAGYLLKTEPVQAILDQLIQIAQGKSCFSEAVLKNLEMGEAGYAVKSQTYLTSLTLRQLQVFRHLVRGESVKEVAKVMLLSERAIESHKYRIMQKLGIHDRVELARYAIREGLMPA